jgi:hypothetical protein
MSGKLTQNQVQTLGVSLQELVVENDYLFDTDRQLYLLRADLIPETDDSESVFKAIRGVVVPVDGVPQGIAVNDNRIGTVRSALNGGLLVSTYRVGSDTYEIKVPLKPLHAKGSSDGYAHLRGRGNPILFNAKLSLQPYHRVADNHARLIGRMLKSIDLGADVNNEARQFYQ